MRDDTGFMRIFGEHRRRTNADDKVRIRDDAFIGDLKARLSGLAARDNAARNSGWLIDFSPVRTDAPTERSIFAAVLTSDKFGTREMAVQVGRDWVEIGDGAMESATRSDGAKLDAALASAFRRVVLGWPLGTVDPAKVRPADA